MECSTLMVAVCCLIDEWLVAQPQLRQRGLRAALSDSEVLTIEVVGEYLGIDTDAELYRHFRRHYGDWFPALRLVHRTTFTRHSANLWRVKERLWQHLAAQTPVLATVASRPGFLAIPGDECQDYAADGDGRYGIRVSSRQVGRGCVLLFHRIEALAFGGERPGEVEQLAGGGAARHLHRLTGGTSAVVERFDDGVVARRAAGRHVQCRA